MACGVGIFAVGMALGAADTVHASGIKRSGSGCVLGVAGMVTGGLGRGLYSMGRNLTKKASTARGAIVDIYRSHAAGLTRLSQQVDRVGLAIAGVSAGIERYPKRPVKAIKRVVRRR